MLSFTRVPVVALTAALSLLLVVPQAAYASVEDMPDPTARAAGSVYALAQAGDRVIVAGRFTRFGGRVRANVAAVLPNGKVDRTFDPGTDGIVKAAAVSEDGSTVFLGGRFTTAAGAPRANLAAVDATTGEILADWRADTAGRAPDVNALVVRGDRLYVGGRYTGIDGTTRKRLVALDVANGDLVMPFKPRPNGNVRALDVTADGSKVYAGGAFGRIGGQLRGAHAAELDAATGAATSFDPTGEGGNVVAVALAPDGSRFFYSVENNTVFATNPAGGNDPVWLRKMSGNTQAMAASATGELYIGGHFSQDITTKQKRPYFASIYWGTGELTPWNPQATGAKNGVWAFLVDGDKLHTGGLFRYFDGVLQRGYARFSGTPTP